jgi:hypothetical protein
MGWSGAIAGAAVSEGASGIVGSAILLDSDTVRVRFMPIEK